MIEDIAYYALGGLLGGVAFMIISFIAINIFFWRQKRNRNKPKGCKKGEYEMCSFYTGIERIGIDLCDKCK